MNRNYIQILLVLAFCLLAMTSGKGTNENGLSNETVIIYSVSTRIDKIDYKAQGSIEGGTLIYIKAYGHSTIPSQNKVTVGPYKCIVEENAISGDTISCRTTKAYDPERRWGQKVKLHVENKEQSTCKAENDCEFTFKTSATPYLQFLSPNSDIPNSVVNWNGVWRVDTSSDITKLTIGGYNCNRFQLDNPNAPLNLNDDEIVDDDDTENLTCQISPEIPAGYYNVDSEILYGNFFKKAFSQNLSADGQNEYEFVVTANISSISTAAGGENGNRITISGQGFSNSPENVTVNVGDIQCDIVSVSNTEIVCDLQTGTTQQASADPNIQPFSSGTGVLMTVWQLDDTEGLDDVDDNLETFRDLVSSGTMPQERQINEFINGNWEYYEDNEYEDQGVYARGFFKPPRTGDYKFWFASNDKGAVYLNQTPNDTSFSADNLILEKCDDNSYRKYFTPKDCGAFSEYITLQEGELYWLEVYVHNGGSTGFFTLSVETPDPQDGGDRWINALDDIQKISIVPQQSNQRYSIKVFGTEEEYYLHFYYKNPSTRKVEFDQKTYTRTWMQWADDDEYYIRHINWKSGDFGAELVEAHDLDANGNRCTGCTPEGREWIFDFTLYRGGSKNVLPKCSLPEANCVVQQLQDQGDPVSGSFRLNFLGEPIQVWNQAWVDDIPYHYGSGSLRSGLIDRNDQYISVIASYSGRKEDGYEYFLSFRSNNVKEQLPLIEADASGLSGGISGTSPTIEVTRYIGASANPFYEPVPFDMSFLPSTAPQVEVWVNGIPSRCSDDCTYQTDSVLNAVLDSFSLSNSDLTINLSGLQAGVTLQDISIVFAGSNCENLTGTTSTFTCTLSAIQAGDNIPKVLISGQGFASYSGNPETILPTITNIDPDTVGINGGNTVTITGTGFPINDISSISVQISGQDCNILSTSSTSIEVTAPAVAAGSANVVVTSFTKDSQGSNTITYTNVGVASITTIDPLTASPVIKQDIVIDGSSFGASVNDVEVWLINENGEKTYELNVLPQNFASDQITARLGGGHVGIYTLAIFNTMGISQNNPTFKYIITLDSVSPQTSQDKGGQIVTLTGTNFSKLVSDNNVFLTDGVENLQCEVISCTQTEIVVKTPARTSTVNNNNLEFVVQGRLVENSTCTGDCTFSYSGSSPEINDFDDKNMYVFEEFDVTGTGFVAQGDPYLLVSGEKYIGSDHIVITDSENMTITVPDIPAGYHVFFVYLGDAGLAGFFELKIKFYATRIYPQEELSLGGQDIRVKGSGFDENTSVYVNGAPCPVINVESNYITCISPVFYEEGDYLVTVSKPQFETDESSYKAKYRNSVTNTANTDLTGQANKFYDQSLYIEGFQPVEYKVYTTEASASFSFNLVDTNPGDTTLEVYLQSTQDYKFRLTGVVQGNQVTFSNIVAGNYRIYINFVDQGFAQLPAGSVWEVVFTLPDSTISSGEETGLNGGTTLTVSGTGFSDNNNKVVVCGQICDITASSFDEVQCTLPYINTQYLDDLQQPTNDVLTPLFDNEVNLVGKVTTNKSNGEDPSGEWDFGNNFNVINLSSDELGIVEDIECWVQFEALGGSKIEFQSLVWNMPFGTPSSREWDEQEDLLYEFIAEGSDDGNNWTQLGENNPYDKVNFIKTQQQQQANFGFGGFKIDEKVTAYKYIRAREQAKEGRQNTCHYQSIYLFGRSVYENEVSDNSDLTCGVKVYVNKKISQNNDTVSYKGNLTPIIENVFPSYVSIVGGDDITITGQNLGSASVTIDGIVCNISSNTNTQIVCQTQLNDQNPVNSELRVEVNGVPAVIGKEVLFFSGLVYSDEINTWSGESVPRDGDSVFVPKGQTLLIDTNNEGVLNTVIVEGTLVFQDGVDLEFNARYIIVRSGRLVIGTEQNPHTSNLRITMHGTKEDSQLPEFGNKVLGCHTCQLDIHGQEKIPTWSTLKVTVDIDATSITLNDGQTNWAVGDEIGIAPTGWSATENEKRIIATINHSDNGDVITFTKPLEFKHLSVIEDYDGTQLPMQAEVVNLTRNIKFRGNPDDSIVNKYGGHLKVHGNSSLGSVVRLSYIEFQYTGQPEIIGRYNVHFHMIGNAIRSYVKGIAAHDTFARLVAVHSVHNLLIKYNVGFNNQGHNIFLEDGSETGNVIDSNVVISPRSAQNMLQTDITVAGIWVTHPSNYVRFNHVAGSEFYGMWYEIKERVGTSPDICPIGNKILEVKYNVAHSNTRFGERFFNLQPRKYPCRAYRNDTLADPWDENPSFESVFVGGNYWKNGESGILAEFVGNSIFRDYLLADNYRTGFQTHVTNFTDEYVILENSLIVGETTSNGGQPEGLEPFETSAILMPRTDGFLARNIEIHNFPAGYNIIESSSENQHKLLWVQGGYESVVEGLTLTNCENAGIIKWQGPRRNLVYDKDGSLTGTSVPTWISPYYNYYNQLITDGVCVKPSTGYDDSVYCTTPLRGMRIAGMAPLDDFIGQSLRIFNLQDTNEGQNFGNESENYDYFDKLSSVLIKNKAEDNKYGYAAVIPTGYTYNAHWSDGIDFDAALLYPSYSTQPDDPTTILRFNYTETRELFDITRVIGGEAVELFTPGGSLSEFVDENFAPNNSAEGCTSGEYFDDKENQFLYLCINGKNRNSEEKYQQIEIGGVFCRDTCSNGFECAAGDEKLLKQFQNSNQATNQVQYDEQPLRKLPGEDEWQTGVPQEGDDLLIPCNWVLSFNVEEWTFGTLIIDGTFRVEEGFDNVHIKATNIWVRGGKFIAGNPEEGREYTKKLTIELVGNENSEPLLIDDISQTGTKSFAVTQDLELYGKIPSTTRTWLTSTVQSGDNTITVQDDIADWQVGDQIVLGASKIDGSGFEKHTITAINYETKTVTLENNIENWHYGHQNPTVAPIADAEVQVSEKYGGNLDLRTEVGHITRNIKIIGSNEGNIGGHLQIYHYILEEDDTTVDVRGSALLQGVELSNMGQPSSPNAGLHILYTNLPKDNSLFTVLKGSSIHDCNGICVNGNYANMVKIENSVIYNGERFLIQALNCKQWKITDNLLIGVKIRAGGNTLDETDGLWDPVAIIHMYTPYLPSIDQHEVKRNVASGTEGIGYAFPGTPCEEKDDNQFKDNQVSYTPFSGVLFNMPDNKCYAAGFVQVHSGTEGVVLNMKKADDGYQAEGIMVAECKTNIILHSASKNHIIHNNFLNNSWIGALVRTSCEDCYTGGRNLNSNVCSDEVGIQLHVTTESGEAFPWTKTPFQYDVICTAPASFQSCFLQDVEFYHFKESYEHSGASLCGNNNVFKNHPTAASASSGTYLEEVSCTDCDYNSYFIIEDEKEAWQGWFGGCGDFTCTGLENLIVQDLTGDFLGHQGTMIGHNESIGDNLDSCVWVGQWNAYDCQDNLDFGVLEWNSEGADKQEITPIPVFVENDSFRNKVNMWREWGWQGGEPLNKRLNRFTSLILVNQWTKIEYSGTQSVNLVYKLQQRNPVGENDRYIIIENSYPTSLALEVRVRGTLINSFPLTNPGDLNNEATNCGANNYFSSNSTIQFVVTNEPDCQVQIKQINQIFVNMRIQMTQEQFYSDDALQTDFASRISAFLGISTDRVRIVGLSSANRRNLEDNNNSSVMGVSIADEEPFSQEDGYDPVAIFERLRVDADSLISSSLDSSFDLGVPIEDAYYELYVLKKVGLDATKDEDFVDQEWIDNGAILPDDDDDNNNNGGRKKNSITEKEEKNSNTVAIALGVIFGIIGILIIALAVYYFWKKKQVQKIQQSNLNIPQDEDKQAVKQVDNVLSEGPQQQAS